METDLYSITGQDRGCSAYSGAALASCSNSSEIKGDGDLAASDQSTHTSQLLVKAKAYNTYIAPQAAYRSCSGACVTDRAGVQPIGRRLSLRLQTLTYEQTAICTPGLPCNVLTMYS